MNSGLRKLIRTVLNEEAVICEVKVKIDDPKKRDFVKHLEQMYREGFKELNPSKILGTIGPEQSRFTIELKNGDKLEYIRNVNPAYGIVSINGEQVETITSSRLFTVKMPDIVKSAYFEYQKEKTIPISKT